MLTNFYMIVHLCYPDWDREFPAAQQANASSVSTILTPGVTTILTISKFYI